MACRYTYEGKTYEAHEFDDVLKSLGPAVMAKFISGIKATPDAPFIGKDPKPMVSLAIKRMIRYAAENGYDKVAFINGDQSADRYDLSQKIDAIRATRKNEEYVNLKIKPAGESSYDENMEVTIPIGDLEGQVGKELAEKISEQPIGKTVTRSGLDLKVGGEGMKKFYDEIIPQVANDVLKKLGGGKVGSTSVNTDMNSANEFVIREREQGDFALRGRVDRNADYAPYGVYPTREAAEARMRELKAGTSWSNQPAIEITPAMKEKVMAGQALFSPSQQQVESPEFKRWAKGLPVYEDATDAASDRGVFKLYHATTADFSEFKPGGLSPTDSGEAIWASPYKEHQAAYFRTGSGARTTAGTNVMPIYMRLANPLVIDTKDMLDWARDVFAKGSREFPQLIGPDAVKEIKGEGYDGIIFKGDDLKWGDNSNEFIAFEPTQIKSAIGNNGQFDPKNPDIRYSPAQQQAVPAETKAQAALRVMQDKFNRFEVVQNWLKDNGHTIDDSNDVYRAEERYHGRVGVRLKEFRERLVNPLVQKIQRAGLSMEQMSDYLHAAHAEERNKAVAKINDQMPDGGSGMKTKVARDLLAGRKVTHNGRDIQLSQDQIQKAQALALEVRAISEKAKQLLLKEGILTPEQVQAWDTAYQNYVPLKGDEVQSGAGKGLSAKDNHKRAMGHGERNEAIIENIIRDYESAVMTIEKNRIGKIAMKLLLDIKNPDIGTVGLPEKRAVLKSGDPTFTVMYHGSPIGSFGSLQEAKAQIAYESSKPGRGINDFSIDRSFSDPRVIYQASSMLGENEAQVYVGGKVVRLQFNDEILARAYKNLGVDAIPWILKPFREVNTFLSKAYTGYNPEFILVNMARDLTAGLINASGRYGMGTAAKALLNYPKSIYEMWAYNKGAHGSPAVRQYLMSGGSTGAAYLSDLERTGADIKSAYEEYQGALEVARKTGKFAATKVAFRKLIKSLASWIEHLNAAGENAFRLATFKAVLDKTGSVTEASSAAKNVTVNFNRKGEIANQIGALYLFYNPNVQGTKIMIDTLMKSPHKYQAIALTTAMASLSVMAAMQFGDDEWEKISDDEKQKGIVLRLPNGNRFVMPLPYGFGFFAGLGHAARDVMDGKDKEKVAMKVAESFAGNFSPFGNFVQDPLNSVPLTPLKLAMLAANNKNGMGGDIGPESPYDESKPDHLKMYRSTKGSVYEDISKMLNKAGGGTSSQAGHLGTSVSPETLKFWMSSIFGGTGRFITDSASLIRVASQGGLGETEFREYPAFRKFVKESDIRDVRRLYYEKSAEAKEAAANFRRAKKMGDDEYEASGHSSAAVLKLIHANQKRIKAKRDAIDEIVTDNTKTLSEKRLMIKGLEKEEEEIYQTVLEAMKKK